ncbi:hypothetical protein DL769_007676 [Monosporascus sp. CRB-8-3]|nr:hypothetical protein DL769_007676 [Monosporascus sp. CRB-8-3]
MLYAVLFFFFVLAASTGAATRLHTVEDVPPIDPSTGLPYGYAKNDIVWTGFESILGDSEAMASSKSTVLTGLVINGTVEHVMAQVERMGFPIRPVEDASFDAKMTAIEARGGKTEPPTDEIHTYERTQNRTRTCRVGGGGPVQHLRPYQLQLVVRNLVVQCTFPHFPFTYSRPLPFPWLSTSRHKPKRPSSSILKSPDKRLTPSRTTTTWLNTNVTSLRFTHWISTIIVGGMKTIFASPKAKMARTSSKSASWLGRRPQDADEAKYGTKGEVLRRDD